MFSMGFPWTDDGKQARALDNEALSIPDLSQILHEL